MAQPGSEAGARAGAADACEPPGKEAEAGARAARRARDRRGSTAAPPTFGDEPWPQSPSPPCHFLRSTGLC